MDLSFVAIDRIVENGLRRSKKQKHKMLLSDSRKLSDEEHLKKLASIGISLDRKTLKGYCENSPSAQKVAEDFYKKYNVPDSESNACWHAITVLWERWFPDLPHLESLDYKMQEGYQLLNNNTAKEKAINLWQEYWNDAKWMIGRWDLFSINEFDRQLAQTQSLFNWCQDFERELSNAAIGNKEFNRVRLSFCSEIISFIDGNSVSLVQNMRRAIAECHFNLGKPETADELFRQWLNEDPQWTWGWIGWADCYSFFKDIPTNDFPKAEKILREALGKENLEDKEFVLDRLIPIYKEMGDESKAKEVTQQMRMMEKSRKSISETAAIEPATIVDKTFNKKKKTGRNAPCPCGSGKKFKKCCGKG